MVGILPDSEGELEDLDDITSGMYWVLLLWCCAFMAVSGAVTRVTAYLEPAEESFQERLLGVVNNWACMSFSWTTLMLFRYIFYKSTIATYSVYLESID